MRPANSCIRERTRGSVIERGRPKKTDWHRIVTRVRILDEAPVLVNGQIIEMKARYQRRLKCDEIRVEHKFGSALLVQSLGLSVAENVALVWRYDDIKRISKADTFSCTFKMPPFEPTFDFAGTHTVNAVRTLAIDVYNSSDADLTRAYYALLQQHGIVGHVATHLFRATKCSKQIAQHRDEPKYKTSAIDRKEYAINSLTTLLYQHRHKLKYEWGWQIDKTVKDASNFLIITLPTGTVWFYSVNMPRGRFRADLNANCQVTAEYTGRHPDMRAMRVFKFCDQVVAGIISDRTQAGAETLCTTESKPNLLAS